MLSVSIRGEQVCRQVNQGDASQGGRYDTGVSQEKKQFKKKHNGTLFWVQPFLIDAIRRERANPELSCEFEEMIAFVRSGSTNVNNNGLFGALPKHTHAYHTLRNRDD